ncbi:MAG: ankyrin repeat domain-containing protein [bacterium]|nr:ankyrin repeat domain-containing protein [bacterium]
MRKLLLRKRVALSRPVLLVGLVALAGCAESIQDQAARGNVEAVRAMIDGDPDLLNARNHRGKTALHMALSSDHDEVISLLIERGADVNARDNTGMTPLHVVAWYCVRKRAGQLLEAGADIEAKDDFGATPLHIAAREERLAMVHYLGKHGAELEAKDGKGRTPLDVARESGKQEAVVLLKELAAGKW